MDKKQQAIFDLFKVFRDGAIVMDLKSKEETVARAERVMKHLKPGVRFIKDKPGFALSIEDIFEDIWSKKGGNDKPLASDFFKGL